MYLGHVVNGLTFTELGRLHARDRTTVAHGCALIEDARDNPAFDRTLSALEYALLLQHPAMASGR